MRTPNSEIRTPNDGIELVARELLRDAAMMHRWSKHAGGDADREVAPTRAAAAQIKARAAFRLLGTTKIFTTQHTEYTK